MVVYKFPLEISGEQKIDVPKGTKFLSVQDCRGVLCFWGLCDPNRLWEKVSIRIYGTGYELDVEEDSLQYIGTAQTHDNTLVWHVFKEL